MNILILSCGTRNELVSFFKKTVSAEGNKGLVICTDCSEYAPALYEADKYYIVPRMTEDNYLPYILDICKNERVDAVLPLQEDELYLISNNRELFETINVRPIVSATSTIELCRDKYLLYQHLLKHNVPVIVTASSVEEFVGLMKKGIMNFPVFVKPRCGCGSIGIMKVDNFELLQQLVKCNDDLIIQNYVDGKEYGVDAYVDMLNGQPVSIFVKEKIRMRAGETEKAVSTKNDGVFELVKRTLKVLDCVGPIDIDIFEMHDQYYISEINPRFGGGYPHAYGCGVDFPRYIYGNIEKIENKEEIGNYKENMCMMKYTISMIRAK